MIRKTVSAIPALAMVLAVGVAVGGCAAATATTGAATTGAAPASSASSATAPAAQTSAAFYGPPGPDPACAAALKAMRTLQTRQGKDQNSQSAINKDFTNFANALTAAAQEEKHPAVASAMTTLADDYNALVESQSGAVPLPSMSAVQNDGTAFNKACP
jgi:hypothetical protein